MAEAFPMIEILNRRTRAIVQLFILVISCCTQAFAGIQETIATYEVVQQKTYNSLCEKISTIATTTWGEKFGYWAKINYKRNPEEALPKEYFNLVQRYIGLELGKIGETIQLSKRFTFQQEADNPRKSTIKKNTARAYVSLWTGRLIIPKSVILTPSRLDFAKFGLQRAIFGGLAINTNMKDVFFNGVPTRLYMDYAESSGIVVHIRGLQNGKMPLYSTIPERIPEYNSSYLWGLFQEMSRKPKFCSTLDRIESLFRNAVPEYTGGKIKDSTQLARASAATWVYILEHSQEIDMTFAEVEIAYVR